KPARRLVETERQGGVPCPAREVAPELRHSMVKRLQSGLVALVDEDEVVLGGRRPHGVDAPVRRRDATLVRGRYPLPLGGAWKPASVDDDGRTLRGTGRSGVARRAACGAVSVQTSKNRLMQHVPDGRGNATRLRT